MARLKFKFERPAVHRNMNFVGRPPAEPRTSPPRPGCLTSGATSATGSSRVENAKSRARSEVRKAKEVETPGGAAFTKVPDVPAEDSNDKAPLSLSTAFITSSSSSNSSTLSPTSAASGPAPLLFSLSEPVDVGDPEKSATDPALVALLEMQATEWVAVVDRVSQRVHTAPPVHADTLVKDLPLAELRFWEQRTRQLEPLSKQAETNFMKNVTNVLMLAGSEAGDALRKAFSALRRLYIEAKWNAKYLKILERPFKILSEGSIGQIAVTIPGMVRTMRMTCVSSRFYTSVEKMDNLVERVTLALCVRLAAIADPAALIVSGDSISSLSQLISIFERWESCVMAHDGEKEKAEAAGTPTSFASSKSSAQANESPERKPSALREGCAWDLLNWTRLLQRPRHMKDRCKELKQLFSRFSSIRQGIEKVRKGGGSIPSSTAGPESGSSIGGAGEGEIATIADGIDSDYRSTIAKLLKASAKRAHPRIGVLTTAAEGVFEVRCASRWKQSLLNISNECMKLESHLSELGGIDPIEEVTYEV